MKEFLLLFTIIELMVLISGVPERCVNDGVKHSYPGDNTKFVICEKHIPLAKKCPIDTTFNQNLQVCNSLDNSDSDSNSRNVIRTSRAATRPRLRPVKKPIKPKVQKLSSSNSPNKRFERINVNQHSSKPNKNYSQGQNNNNKPQHSKPNKNYSQGQNNNNKPQHSNTDFDSYGNDHQNINSDKGQWLHRAVDTLVHMHGQHNYNKQQYSNSDFGGNYDHTNINSDNEQWLPNQNQDLEQGYIQGQYNTNEQQASNSDFGGNYNDHKNINSDNGWLPNQNHGLDLDEGQYNNNEQQSNSDFGGNYNDHKNINSDNRWLPNQNHGLDQNHINLNGKHGSTGHLANSCNNVPPGKHISYPGDCTKFIVCMPYGNTVVKDCGLGTHFNPQIQVCDWPQSAGCRY